MSRTINNPGEAGNGVGVVNLDREQVDWQKILQPEMVKIQTTKSNNRKFHWVTVNPRYPNNYSPHRDWRRVFDRHAINLFDRGALEVAPHPISLQWTCSTWPYLQCTAVEQIMPCGWMRKRLAAPLLTKVVFVQSEARWGCFPLSREETWPRKTINIESPQPHASSSKSNFPSAYLLWRPSENSKLLSIPLGSARLAFILLLVAMIKIRSIISSGFGEDIWSRTYAPRSGTWSRTFLGINPMRILVGRR